MERYRHLLSTGVDSSNLIEKAYCEEYNPASVDWSGPFYLFLREGHGGRFLDVLVGGPYSEEESRSAKRVLRDGGRVKHWNESACAYL